jgi:hypothetical protein
VKGILLNFLSHPIVSFGIVQGGSFGHKGFSLVIPCLMLIKLFVIQHNLSSSM